MRAAVTVLIAIALLCFAGQAFPQVRVKGYFRKNGTYVAPHYRSAPNSSRSDNYSSKGNYNPYTGKKGTVDPYRDDFRYVLPTLQQPYAPTTTSTTSYSVSAIDQANSELKLLEGRLREDDPFFSVRGPVISLEIQRIKATIPPERWADEVARMYWAIPAAKDGIGSLVPSGSGLASFTVTPARESSTSEGNDRNRADVFAQTCRLGVSVSEGDLSQVASTASPPRLAMEAADCYGYVRGFVEGHNMTADHPGNRMQFCVPAGTSNIQLARAVLRAAEARPDIAATPRETLVEYALKLRWPCDDG